MIPAHFPDNEQERLEALRAYSILDTPPEQEFDDLTRLASQICGTSIALISLVEHDRQWFKSRVGLDAAQTARDVSFCSHAILEEGVFEVPDALEDVRFVDNPLVTGDPNIRFYAGQPLMTTDGLPIGTLCVIDNKPKHLSPDQAEALQILGRQVIAQMELRRTLSQLARAHESLMELSSLKDDFMRIASHDLKNPLTILLSSSHMLRQMAASPAGIGANSIPLTEMISRTSHNMQRIIEDFLDFRAVADGKLSLNLQPLALNDLIQEEVANQLNYAAQKAIELKFDASGPRLTVNADSQRLRQVLTNLIGNALKFSPPGTFVEVSIRAEGPAAIFKVRDEGPGLRPEDFERLFQRYARLSNKPTGTESSSGIGLYICKELIDLHGGEIGAQNNSGGPGTTFWFKLPLLNG